jgi:CBS domain-containing protein
MTLSEILATKGSAVETAAPHRTIGEVVAILSEKKIGALVVVSGDGEVLGMLSERDVIRALAQKGESALHDAVSKHMTSRVVAATESMSVIEAMTRMTNGRFRHMPVIENGRLTGMISIGDVVKQRIEDVERERQSILDYIGTA